MKIIIFFFVVFNFLHSQNPASFDSQFGVNGRVSLTLQNYSSEGYAIANQSDGKILVAGEVFLGGTWILVTRLNPDGTIDTSFGNQQGFRTINISTSSTPRSKPRGIHVQSDGKILITASAGNSHWSGTQNDFAIIRLNSNGTTDTSYGNLGVLKFDFGTENAGLSRSIMDANERVIMVGQAKTLSETSGTFAIARINQFGYLDDDFSNDGKILVPFENNVDNAVCVSIQNDSKILVGGVTNRKIAVTRLTDFGNLDLSFGTNGKLVHDLSSVYETLNGIRQLSDGKIICGGTLYTNFNYNTSGNVFLLRLNSNGSVDTTYGNSGLVSVDIDNTSGDNAQDIILSNNGKVLMFSGCVTGGLTYFAFLRFNSDGVLDTSFNNNGIRLVSFNGQSYPSSFIVQNDGKILGCGYGEGGDKMSVVRLLGDSVLGLSDYDLAKSFKLYPNPVEDKLNLFFSNNYENGNFQIYDYKGNLVLDSNNKLYNNEIDVSNLSTGLYFFKYKDEFVKFVKK